MSKLKIWQPEKSWDNLEQSWDVRAQEAAQKQQVKGLSQLPSMPGITPETAKNLKWKSFKWMVAKDHQRKVLKGFLKHPFRYLWNYLKSIVKKQSFKRDGDFFLYNVEDIDEFTELMYHQDSFLVVGFSYCHKPFECPSGRFTSECIHDTENLVCQQCFIGKVRYLLPKNRTIPLTIPTVHYIGEKIFEVMEQNPDKQVLFIITACEMTLRMFADWGNMVDIRGVGVRLDGRICNTMKAFELSEEGIKPGLTVVLDQTKKRIIDLIRLWSSLNAEPDFNIEKNSKI